MDLITKSKEWQKKADGLLAEKELVIDLSKFGQVHFTGAYSYGLMMHGDIDISIVRKETFSTDEVFEIFKELYLKRKFRSYFIGGDWDDPRKGAEFPNGCYIGLKEKLNGERWKFDLWFLSSKEYDGRKDNSDLSQISEDQRLLILNCKQFRKDNKLNITGQEIYDLVLSGKIDNVEDLMSVDRDGLV